MKFPLPELTPAPERERFELIQRYQSETAEIRYAREPLQARITVFVLAGLLGSLVLLSTVFEIDRVVQSSSGQVVTSAPTVVLQALDPSIIKSIDVSEGQRVHAHQVLATLDPTFAAADLGALRLQISSLDAEVARCEAELAHRPFDPSSVQPAAVGGAGLPAHPPPTAGVYLALQNALYLQRKQQFDATVQADDQLIAQYHATIARIENDEARYKDRVSVAALVEVMRSREESDHVGSQLSRLGATDVKLEIQRNLEADRNSLAETQHQLAGAIYTRNAFVQGWLSTTSLELVTARNSRDAARSEFAKADRHNDLVRVESPQEAIVLSLAQLSVGSVLKQGDPLINLAPLNSPLEIEADVGSTDVGFVRAGDPATIKLDAFQFVEHGTASGHVLYVSEGSFNTDPNTGTSSDVAGRPVAPYYKVRIAMDPIKLHNVPASFRLIPGMTLTADIHVGTRSLFMYLVRGVVRGVDEAMREP